MDGTLDLSEVVTASVALAAVVMVVAALAVVVVVPMGPEECTSVVLNPLWSCMATVVVVAAEALEVGTSRMPWGIPASAAAVAGREKRRTPASVVQVSVSHTAQRVGPAAQSSDVQACCGASHPHLLVCPAPETSNGCGSGCGSGCESASVFGAGAAVPGRECVPIPVLVAAAVVLEAWQRAAERSPSRWCCRR